MSAIVICPECGRDKKRDCFIYDCSYSGCDKKLCSARCSVTHEDRHIIDPDMLARDNHTWWNAHIEPTQDTVSQARTAIVPSLKNEVTEEELLKEVAKRFDWSRALNLDYITRFFFPNYRRRR